MFVVGFTYVLWFWLMARYPASGLSSFAFLSPVFGVLFGGLLLSEPMTFNLLLGLAMIAAGLCSGQCGEAQTCVIFWEILTRRYTSPTLIR